MRSISFSLCTVLLWATPAAVSAAEVVFSDVRIAIEPSEDGMTINEIVLIKPVGGAAFTNPLGTSIPLPQGAVDAQLASDLPTEGLVVKNGDILVTGPIPAAGRQAAFTFTLPVRDDQVSFVQPFPAPVKLAHAAWLGDVDDYTIEGEGFSSSSPDKTPSGAPALFITAQNVDNGRVGITVSGFGKNSLGYLSIVAALVSFLLLAAGFVRWGRGRMTSDPDFS